MSLIEEFMKNSRKLGLAGLALAGGLILTGPDKEVYANGAAIGGAVAIHMSQHGKEMAESYGGLYDRVFGDKPWLPYVGLGLLITIVFGGGAIIDHIKRKRSPDGTIPSDYNPFA